ncbi:MAG: DNA alkylation repair protein [Alphaproteobacteria bacterium]|nr:DNA alkylation repair protein [Alphaproteobacteria bacterium]
MEPFKERIDAAAIDAIAAFVGGRWDRAGFARDALDGLHDLELKARVDHVADALRAHLPDTWPAALGHVLADLPEAPDHADALTDQMGLWPVLACVERHGLAHPEPSLEALERLTPFWSAEFAVRPYFRDDPVAMVRWVDRWSTHPNVHVRRLASEGSRSRLPWGLRLQCRIDEPTALLPALERLRDDPSPYVRRSVANHLNDIAKDHPDVVLDIARAWLPGPTERQKLVRHALRTLVKAGDPRALELLGVGPFAGDVRLERAPSTVAVGGTLALTLTLTARRAQRVRVDYAIHHLRANGSRTPKVFHWTERDLAAGETLVLTKAHPLREVSTRRLYPGEQAVDARVNGQATDPLPFVLHA